MRFVLPLFAAVLLTSGCSEHWYSSADAELDLDIEAFTLVDARVVTPADAWPRDIYGDAVRVGMDDQEVSFVGEVVDGEVIDAVHEIDDHWGDNVNVLDAWDDCTPGKHCDRTFRFEVACADDVTCEGTFSGDAFLSVELPPQHRARTGAPLTLTFTEVN